MTSRHNDWRARMDEAVGVHPGPSELTPPPSRRGTQDFASPTSTPNQRHLPVRTPTLPPNTIPEESDSEPDSRAIEPYNSRRQTFLIEEEEAERREQERSTPVYPTPNTHRRPHPGFYALPPHPTPQASAIPQPTAQSANQLDWGAILGNLPPRKGHTYGIVNAKDESRVLLGGVYNSELALRLLPDNKYEKVNATGNARVTAGDVHVSAMPEFLRLPDTPVWGQRRGTPDGYATAGGRRREPSVDDADDSDDLS